jgi:hypothetical protein
VTQGKAGLLVMSPVIVKSLYGPSAGLGYKGVEMKRYLLPTGQFSGGDRC